MIFSDALEVAIGLTFIYLLISLVMTAVIEAIESFRRTRGARLLDGVGELLGNPQAAAALYAHPLVQGLFRGSFDKAREDKRLPSYIPSRNFALALIDQVLAGNINAAASNASLPSAAYAPFVDRLRLAAERIENPQLRQALIQVLAISGNDAESVSKQLADWYDSAMDRVSGGFKRSSHWMLFWLGLAMAVVLNFNTLTLIDSLTKDATLRRAIVAQAEQQNSAGQAGISGTSAADEIQKIGLPIGWSSNSIDALVRPTQQRTGVLVLAAWVEIAMGYLLTALAITLGSPFWFDMLNRLIVIRATVKPHEKSPEEGSADPVRAPAGSVTLVAGTTTTTTTTSAARGPRPIDSDVYAVLPGADEKPFEE